MSVVYKIVLGLSLCMCGNLQAAAAYKNSQEALQAIVSAHVTAFSVDNLLTSGVPKDGENNWNAALNGAEAWINTVLAKPRSLATEISQKNRDLIKKALMDIRAASNDLITTIKALRAANFNFAQDKYADIDLEVVKLQVAQLVKRADALTALHKSLAPGLIDYEDTKDIKKLLQNIVFTLETTFKKVGNDLDKLRAPINYAIGSKKYGK